MTPHWKSSGLRIQKKIILGHFDPSGPKTGPKRVKKGLKLSFFEILFKHGHVTPHWKSSGLRIENKIIVGYFDPSGPKTGPKRVKKGTENTIF